VGAGSEVRPAYILTTKRSIVEGGRESLCLSIWAGGGGQGEADVIRGAARGVADDAAMAPRWGVGACSFVQASRRPSPPKGARDVDVALLLLHGCRPDTAWAVAGWGKG
jgi:hypothetical protein